MPGCKKTRVSSYGPAYVRGYSGWKFGFLRRSLRLHENLSVCRSNGGQFCTPVRPQFEGHALEAWPQAALSSWMSAATKASISSSVVSKAHIHRTSLLAASQ